MLPADKIATIRLRTVTVPLRRPLIAPLITVRTGTLILIDLKTNDGIEGRSYVHILGDEDTRMAASLIGTLAGWVIGKPLAPRALNAAMVRRFGLYDGLDGALANAIAAIDMAAWDAAARAAGVPLVVHLGGDTTPIRAYHSFGLGILDDDALVAEAREMVAETGCTGVKMRLGRPNPRDDLRAVRALRRSLGDNVHIMVDATQSWDTSEAMRRLHMLDDEGLYWFEDPCAWTDMEGHARLARSLKTPIQTGENFTGPRAVAAAIKAEAADCINFDMRHIGGVTGWLDSAPLAAASNMPLSGHMYPEFSAHMLGISPSRHWLELMDWASPILQRPVTIEGGNFIFEEAPGAGVNWNEDKLRHFGATDLTLS